jgi:hypothetical protein
VVAFEIEKNPVLKEDKNEHHKFYFRMYVIKNEAV